jgi:hypothetical protein
MTQTDVPDPIIRRTRTHTPSEVEAYAASLQIRYELFEDNGDDHFFMDHNRNGRLVGPYTPDEAHLLCEGVDLERDRIREVANENIGRFWEHFDPSWAILGMALVSSL